MSMQEALNTKLATANLWTYHEHALGPMPGVLCNVQHKAKPDSLGSV